MLFPRLVVPDDLKTVGLWSVYPLAKDAKGPRISDLYVIEEIIQSTYGLEGVTV